MCWVVFEVTVGSSNFPRRFHPKVSKGLSGFNVVAELRAPEACAMSGRRERSPRGRSRSNGSGLSSISSARMNQRPLTAAEAAAEAVAEAQRARSQSRARQRARSVPADTSPTYHRPAGVDRRPLPSEGRTNGQLPQLPGMSNAPGQASAQNPVVAQGNGAGGLSESLVRQMLQAQDDQLRAQAVQLQQMGAMLQDAIKLATTTAQQVQQSAASSAAPAAGTADGSGDAAASSSDPVPMDVDSGIRSRRAESYIPQLPQLNFAGMSSRHAEIRIWTAYREELTAWLCLLDDRYAEELREAATSVVEVSQVALPVGKAARSTKLWFLLRQSLSKFQRAQDFVQLIGVQQKGASAGYELWRMLNNELSVRSRVEGQALREQVLSLRAPKHISRALDMMRWYTTELLKYDSQIKPRFPELAVTEQEAILAVLRHLDEEAKRYLLLHGTTSSLEALMRGLQFYDEQLRVLTFQKEHQPGKFLNAFADQGKGKDGKGKDGKGKDGKGKDGKGKKGDPKGGQKGAGKRQKTPKGKGKGKQGGRGRSKSRDKSKDTCNYCHQKGHWAPECPQKKADQQAKASSAAESFGKEPEAESAPSQASNATPKASSAAKGNGKTGAKTGTKSAVLMSLIPGADAMAVSDSKFYAQFLPWKFYFGSMSMHDMVFLLCLIVVLCCVGWLIWRLHGFLRLMYNHPARNVRVAWHNIARARAAFRSSSGVASDFDNWVLLDSGASVTIISEAFLSKCCTVISRGKSSSPVSISTATSESLLVDEEVSCILHCHQPGGEIVGVHIKGYVSEKVPLTLVSTGILGAGGWKIGNKGPLMTLNYSGTRLATHLYANCSWVFAIDSREDYAIETMKDLGISIPPNLGSSLVPASPSSRPGAQITEASATAAKPLSSVTKVCKPATKPEASQAQASVKSSVCECSCEGCLIGNCPKEIRALGLTPESLPKCVCAAMYKTCFAVQDRMLPLCDSFHMSWPSMTPLRLSRILSRSLMCLICLSRVVLVELSEVVKACLSKVVESLVRLNARHLMLKIAFLLSLFCFVSGYGEKVSERSQNYPAQGAGIRKLRCGYGGHVICSAYAWHGACTSPAEVSLQEAEEKDCEEEARGFGAGEGKESREKACREGKAKVQEGKAPFCPGGGQRLCADAGDADSGGVALARLGEGGPRKWVQNCEGSHGNGHAASKWQPLSPAKAPTSASAGTSSSTYGSFSRAERETGGETSHTGRLKTSGTVSCSLGIGARSSTSRSMDTKRGATDIPWIVGRQFVGQNEVQSFDSNLIQQQNASYATTCAHGRPFGSCGATTGTNGRSFGPSDTTTGAGDSSSAKGTSIRAYGSTCSCKRVCTTKVASGKRASCESPSEGGACESHAGGNGALGFGPRLKAEILDVKDVWEKGEFAFQNISSGHMQLQRQRKIGHTRELASACSLSGRVGCSLLSCVGRVGCAADMSTRVFKFPKSRPQRAQYEKERQSSLTMCPAECVLQCKARVEARVCELYPQEGSPEGSPKGFKGSTEGSKEGFYTGIPSGPQEKGIVSPNSLGECMCSPPVQVPQPGLGFRLWSPKKSTFGPQQRSLASTSLSALSSDPQPPAEARCPVFRRHRVTSIFCQVGPRAASECASVVSVLPEQTCHVGCVEFVELVGEEVDSRFVVVDQPEQVVQHQQSRHVEVVLGCVALGEPVGRACGLIPQGNIAPQKGLSDERDEKVQRVSRQAERETSSDSSGMAKNTPGNHLSFQDELSVLQQRVCALEKGIGMAGNEDGDVGEVLQDAFGDGADADEVQGPVEGSKELDATEGLESYTGQFPEKVTEYQKLQHLRQGHYPYWAHCPSCIRGRSYVPARRRKDPPGDDEVQIDQFFYKSSHLICIVHVKSFCVGCSTTFSGEGRATTVTGLIRFLRSFGLGKVSITHDNEPLVTAIAQAIVKITGGTETGSKPSRHAPIAERAIRVIKEGSQTSELHAHSTSGLVLHDSDEANELLCQYDSAAHNRFSRSTGDMLSPLQRVLGPQHIPHLLFPFACLVYAQPPDSLKNRVAGKFDLAGYLGPVIGGQGHHVMIRLRDGHLQRCIASALKLAYPVTYSSNFLPAIAKFNPDEADYESLPGVDLPRKDSGALEQPPESWWSESPTDKCPGCRGKSLYHSKRCKQRYARYLRDSVGEGEERPLQDSEMPQLPDNQEKDVPMHPEPKKVSFGEPEVREYVPGDPPSSEFSEYVPDFPDDALPPSGAPPQERGVDPDEGVPEEGFEPIDLEGEIPERVPRLLDTALCPTIENLENQFYDLAACQLCPLVAVDEEAVDVFVCQLKRKVPAKYEDPSAGQIVQIAGRQVWLSKPTAVEDDLTSLPLSAESTWQGMLKEVSALDSLEVGKPCNYGEARKYCDETGAKIVKSRFVFTDKADLDGSKIVRARLVAKDFAFHQPTALDLGIASQTASVEAFKGFLCRVVQDTLVLWGLDVSTAFLYAKLVLATVLELPSCFQNLDGSTVYMILDKAIYGLRSAGLSWQKHLAALLAELGLFPSLIEPTLYKGYWGDILVLCLVYVDDILLATRSRETNQKLLDFLMARLKVKLTGRLDEDGKISFLGREIIKRGSEILLAVKKEYVNSIFEAFGWSVESRRKLKPATVPPDLRAIYDKEDPEKPSEVLSPEACARFRSTLGKLGWLVQTRGDLCYYHSMLARGQACPRAVHEDCMRRVLRWLLECPDLVQVFRKDPDLPQGCACLLGYSDANWASERSTGRKSTSGGVVYLNGNAVKCYSRLQPIVALSSAESELFALTEAAKELLGLKQLFEHLFDEVASPLPLLTDSSSARQVGQMTGFLRRLRHVDLRLCFLQDRVEAGQLLLEHTPGTENVSDLQTKNLPAKQTWRFIEFLGLEERDSRTSFLGVIFLVEQGALLFATLKSFLAESVAFVADPWVVFVGQCQLDTNHMILMVELCTSENAWLSCLSDAYGIMAIPVTARVDGMDPETLRLLEGAIRTATRRGMHVVVWASTPCTGGSPWQHLQVARDESYYSRHLKGLFTVHRKLWKSFLFLVNASKQPTWVIEWPQRCASWGWASTKSFLRTNSHSEGLVFGCSCGLLGKDGLPVRKVWRLCSSSSLLVTCMAEFKCPGDHQHSRDYVLKDTQHYPEAFARRALKALSAW